MDHAGAAVMAMVVGDALDNLPLQVQLVVLGAMLGSAVWAVRRLSPASVTAFVLTCVVWSRANHRLEGAVLLTLTRDHGLTVADLLPPALSAWILAARLRRRGRSGRTAGSSVAAGTTLAEITTAEITTAERSRIDR